MTVHETQMSTAGAVAMLPMVALLAIAFGIVTAIVGVPVEYAAAFMMLAVLGWRLL